MLSKQRIRDVKELDSYKLSVCHPASAGIDLGSAEIYVALPPSIAAEMDLPIVHRFSTYTSGLCQCRDLLLECGINTVAMESTSVYWTTIYSILEAAGIEVCLVNPKKFRMVPGRKTDILDCQWLQTLHSYGLLRGSFHPVEKIAELRSYMRERDHIIKDRSRYIQRMQKALTKMNLLLHNAIDDITGKTGMAIIRAILTGEFFDKQLEKIDATIVSLLNSFPLKKEEAVICPESNKSKYPHKGKNVLRTKENLRDILYRIMGVDMTSITGFQANTILQVISEVGTDMSKFPTADHFASYLGFVPHHKITGGAILSSKTDRIKSSAAQAFKKIVPSITQGKSALAAFYRRVAFRAGTGKAIIAVCRKLAIIFYNTLVKGVEYVEIGQEKYKEQQQEREKALLIKLAKKHNLELVTVI